MAFLESGDNITYTKLSSLYNSKLADTGKLEPSCTIQNLLTPVNWSRVLC